MWVLKVPLSSPISKNKKFILNLNHYRNAHYQVLSKAKNNYADLVHKLLGELCIPRLGKIRITYTVFFPTKAKIDVSNICSIVDKFFCDAIVSYGVIEDDNFNFIDEVKYKYGGYSPEDPHVLVHIEPVITTNRRSNMRIILNNSDIQDALLAHIESAIQVREGQEVSFVLAETDDGWVADVAIGEPSISKPAAAARKPRATPKAKEEPKEAPAEEPKKPEAPAQEENKPEEPASTGGGMFGTPASEPAPEQDNEQPQQASGGLFGGLSMVNNKK